MCVFLVFFCVFTSALSCLTSSLLLLLLLSIFLHPKKTVFVERVCVRLFPCSSSHWRHLQFPRSVLFCPPHQQLFTYSSKDPSRLRYLSPGMRVNTRYINSTRGTASKFSPLPPSPPPPTPAFPTYLGVLFEEESCIYTHAR